jgi:hypothetical protein
LESLLVTVSAIALPVKRSIAPAEAAIVLIIVVMVFPLKLKGCLVQGPAAAGKEPPFTKMGFNPVFAFVINVCVDVT